MAKSGTTEALALISGWYSGLHLAETNFRIEQCEADNPKEPGCSRFQFRPTRIGCFDLDIIVSNDGYWGMGVMHPEHSKTVFSWGFEGTNMSCETVLRVARHISEGHAEIVVSRIELSKTVGWLELSPQALSELQGLSHGDRIRRKTTTHFFQKRLQSLGWR